MNSDMHILEMGLLQAITRYSNHLQQFAKDYQSLEVGWRLVSTKLKEYLALN
jgi:hypothetical protein